MVNQTTNTKTDAYESIADGAVRHALRSFSGRIAHDFNNMLTMLMAYPQLIKRNLSEDSQGYELLGVMESNAERMAGISARLAKFASEASADGKVCELDSVIRDFLNDLKQDSRADGVNIVADLTAACAVTVPKDVLCTILEEISLNACESMCGSGTLEVSTDLFALDASRRALGATAPPGFYARIRIADSGKGISEDQLERIIEPFFTLNKRNKARGAGLGLSIVYAILCDCNGYLQAENTGDGFTVSVLLPLAQSPAGPDGSLDKSSAVRSVATPAEGPPRKVLVVDDEEDILSIFRLILNAEIENVQVDTALNGAEALESFKARKYDVIVMDLHMPVMDGHEAFNRLVDYCRQNNERVPAVVFCTGYVPPRGIKQAIADNNHFSLLQKPVDARSLVNAVQQHLEEE